MDFVDYPLVYQRLTTREVSIGDLKIGGDHPILVQSMLVAPASHLDAAFAEIQALIQAGCSLIRLTIPTQKELDCIPLLRKRLLGEGISVPLVADIHFSPALAIQATEHFEKVRINPGNFSDSPKNSNRLLDGAFFDEGYQKLKESLQPLIAKVKEHGTALRVGVNQGSLSERIMEQYGDSPLGMVESALECCTLLEGGGVDQVVISMKSSNPVIVQKAYRLLVQRQQGSLLYPMHLGVTEAGEGEMARVKSLAGIATLLRDGIGDTIRVSLTEPSINEIPFAQNLITGLQPLIQAKPNPNDPNKSHPNEGWQRPLNHKRVGNQDIKIGDLLIGGSTLFRVALEGSNPILVEKIDPDFIGELQKDSKEGDSFVTSTGQLIPLLEFDELTGLGEDSFVNGILLKSLPPLLDLRAFYQAKKAFPGPVGVVAPHLSGDVAEETEFAALLSEGLLDFILLPKSLDQNALDRVLLYLQATRQKSFTADYIACPSCGRTLFDLQKTTQIIKEKTYHLKGVKIGIMGCVVNGPGEMADADFGYVGSGPGKIDLYFGQERVKRGVNEEQALEDLISLIKEKGAWIDPKPLSTS